MHGLLPIGDGNDIKDGWDMKRDNIRTVRFFPIERRIGSSTYGVTTGKAVICRAGWSCICSAF